MLVCLLAAVQRKQMEEYQEPREKWCTLRCHETCPERLRRSNYWSGNSESYYPFSVLTWYADTSKAKTNTLYYLLQ